MDAGCGKYAANEKCGNAANVIFKLIIGLFDLFKGADSEQAFLTKSVAEYLMETNDIDTMFGFAPAVI